MRRRNVLVSGATFAAVGLAGCQDDDANRDDDSDDSVGEGNGDDSDDMGETDDGDHGDDSDDAQEDDDQEDEPEELTELLLHETDDYYDDDPMILDGEGSGETDFVDIGATFYAVIFDYTGDGEVVIDCMRDDGSLEQQIVVGDGPVKGASGLATTGGNYYFDVEASGEWIITLVSPEPATTKEAPLPVEVAGDGTAVVGPVDVPDDGVVTISAEDGGELIVEQNEPAGDREGVVLDTEPPVEETVDPAFTGRSWFTVHASDEWSLAVE